MTKEEEFVVNPLCAWLQGQKADWNLSKPNHGRSATGWDIVARRKNMDLLIEAKYIDKQSITSAVAGLLVAPLSNRPQADMKTKYRSWCHYVCWAIGMKPNDTRNIYQALFDYFSRNVWFWNHYCEDLRLKYIFFVRDKKIAKVSFETLLNITIQYDRESAGKKLNEKRAIADALMRDILKFS